jgi:hypothetical protein
MAAAMLLGTAPEPVVAAIDPGNYSAARFAA